MNKAFSQAGDLVKVKACAAKGLIGKTAICVTDEGKHSIVRVRFFNGELRYMRHDELQIVTVPCESEPKTFTQEEVKALCEKAWDEGYDCHYSDCNSFTSKYQDFEQFWNANKPQNHEPSI